MLIALTSEQETWIKASVASGAFASVEEAARRLIDERISERAAEVRGEPPRQALWVEELSAAELEAIAATEMDPRHDHLDGELR